MFEQTKNKNEAGMAYFIKRQEIEQQRETER